MSFGLLKAFLDLLSLTICGPFNTWVGDYPGTVCVLLSYLQPIRSQVIFLHFTGVKLWASK